MYEKSDAHQLQQQILDHPNNQGMDPHNRRDLERALENMTNDNLHAELERLEHDPNRRTKVKEMLIVAA